MSVARSYATRVTYAATCKVNPDPSGGRMRGRERERERKYERHSKRARNAIIIDHADGRTATTTGLHYRKKAGGHVASLLTTEARSVRRKASAAVVRNLIATAAAAAPLERSVG